MVVCTLRVLDGVWRGYPEAGYFLDCLIGYPTSGLTPATIPELSPEERLTLFIVGPDAMEQKTNGTIVIPCRNEEPD